MGQPEAGMIISSNSAKHIDAEKELEGSRWSFSEDERGTSISTLSNNRVSKESYESDEHPEHRNFSHTSFLGCFLISL